MWNESERVSRYIAWGFLALLGVAALAAVAETAACCGLAAAAWFFLMALVVFGGCLALGFAANGVIIGALALVVKTFRFLFHIKGC